MNVRERLAAAIGTGEVIGIVYHGGSQPGAFRDISPLGFEGDRLRARCHTSGAVKTFNIEKIELRGVEPTADDRALTWRVGYAPKPIFQTLSEVHAALREELEAMGWLVVHDDAPHTKALLLHAAFKNGKTKKTPDASLAYQELATIARATEDGEVILEVTGPRVRPWIVAAKTISPARTFAECDKAAEVFLEVARELAPVRFR